jgi:hypothetical protein
MELSVQNLPFGVAYHSKPALIKYYQQTNQHFLAKYEFLLATNFWIFFLKYGFLGPVVFVFT